MCGFFAIFRLSKRQISEEAFISAAKQMLSRGGNQQTYFFGLNRKFVLFHTRLIVCGNNLVGTQPQITPNGRYGILYNGEIYNYRELAQDLELNTTSDTAVLVEGFNRYGEKFLERLSGIFAITVVDFETNRLLLHRDALGIKPLYHYRTDDYLAVASTPKAIYEFFGETSLDKNAFLNWLEFGSDFFGRGLIMGLSQPYPGVSEWIDLATGKFMSEKVSPSEALQQSLLRFDNKHQKQNQNFNASNSLSDVMDFAFDRQVPTDQPLAVFLSGGIDSSYLAYELARRNPNVEAHTASFVLEDGTINNIEDVVAAKKVAEHLGIKHVITEVCVEQVPIVLEELIGHFASPFFDSAVVPLFLLSKKIKESDIKVVFSGDGADELFGGYPRHSFGPLLQSSKIIPIIFQTLNLLGLLHPKLRRAFSLSRDAEDPDKLLLRLISAANNEIRQGYASIFPENLVPQTAVESQIDWSLDSSLDFQTKLFGLDLSHILPDLYLQKTDRATASHGLECRVPFLDEAIVCYSKAERCYDVSGLSRTRKIDFKKLAQQKLPKRLTNRVKRGFGVPFSHWLETDICKNHAMDAFDKVAGRKIVNAEAKTLFSEPNFSTASLAWKVYMLLLFLKVSKINLKAQM